MSDPADIPEGFTPLQRGSGPFLAALGPLYSRQEPAGMVIGLRIEEKHLNTRGVAHGGMLVTFADSALGIVLALAQDPPRPMATVSLTADFAEAGRAGDWLEARVDVQKLGRRLAFASCHLWVRGKRILRTSGIFARVASGKRGGT